MSTTKKVAWFAGTVAVVVLVAVGAPWLRRKLGGA